MTSSTPTAYDISGRSNKIVRVACNMSDVSATTSILGGQAWVQSPVRGRILRARGTLHGAITVADSNISLKVNSTAVTGATAVIANSGSAAGDKYTITPSTMGSGEAGGRVVPGDSINIISDGGSSTTAAMTWVVEIMGD